MSRLGWDDRWEAARAGLEGTPVRIVAEHRGAYHAMGEELQPAWVELTGKAFHDAKDKRALPTVGDWVLVDRWADALAGTGAAVIRSVLPRRSFLVRRAAGEAEAPQPLAANVDTGIVMTSANTDLSPARLDRYLGLLRDGGIDPVIAVSKIDLATDDTVLREAEKVGARVVAVSSVTGAGLAEIRALSGAGKTCVLLGSSGVGKSSLLNALAPGLDVETGELRKRDQRGRHTTTRAIWVELEGRAVLVDTPGVREIATGPVDPELLRTVFPDIDEKTQECRFGDCRHDREPDCAVRDAVQSGALAAARVARYRRLHADVAAAHFPGASGRSGSR